MWLILGFSVCILVVQAVDWSERYDGEDFPKNKWNKNLKINLVHGQISQNFFPFSMSSSEIIFENCHFPWKLLN
jgi:hypothetical protein